MNRNRRLRLGLLAAVVLLAAAAPVTWRSFAAPPGDGPAVGLGGPGISPVVAMPASAAPVPGGPGFYSQSALVFRPYVASSGYAYDGGDLYNPSATLAAYEGPVSLPHGATITKLVAYYWDSSATEYLNVNLYRIGLDSGSVELMAQVYSTGNAGHGSVQTASIAQPVVDQQSYAYVAEAQIPGNVSIQVRFVGIRIDYAFDTDLPLVMKG
jgi:hypothetical protein